MRIITFLVIILVLVENGRYPKASDISFVNSKLNKFVFRIILVFKY